MKSNQKIEEPLFIQFLNSKIDRESISTFLSRLATVFPDKEDKAIVLDHKECLKDHRLEGYKLLQTKLKDHVDYLIDNKVFDTTFPTWANFYLSSLRETKTEDKKGNIDRRIRIGDRTGDWFSGIILYNFSLFYRYYGSDPLHRCEAKVYFVTNSKWSKFCSEKCKDLKSCRLGSQQTLIPLTKPNPERDIRWLKD
jgi:endogenous inhibitor of DNA gyrase (YacG/DUF329 family)